MIKQLFATLFNVKGFAKIANSFEAKPFPPREKSLRTTVQAGSVRYRQCASILLDNSGIYVEISYVFNQYPTTFIPWQSIQNTRKATLYGANAICFDFADQNIPSLLLYEKDVKAFRLKTGDRLNSLE